MRRERPGQTLQATALVHEAYLRLAGAGTPWHDKRHFVGIAARSMRQILVERARARGAQKRWAGLDRVSLPDSIAMAADQVGMLPALDDALTRLEKIDPEQARIVELRYFAGLSIEETADALGMSPATLKRRWALARAWLFRDLSEPLAVTPEQRRRVRDLFEGRARSRRRGVPAWIARRGGRRSAGPRRGAVARRAPLEGGRVPLAADCRRGARPAGGRGRAGAGRRDRRLHDRSRDRTRRDGARLPRDDARLGRTVALKALAPHLLRDPAQRERLRREARSAASLTHPGICTVYALEEIDGDLYIATEFVDGHTLARRDRIRQRPSLARRDSPDGARSRVGARQRARARASCIATSNPRT